ncbi:MAG: Spo0B domain-containing protein [Firmicutes bacterium]|jgi:hypothetical protein|nr:Spo0B domain-containing protein [Bacillota bacterium]MCL5970963.1 Spo0B domain-containing protein [Bacillota bacterium]
MRHTAIRLAVLLALGVGADGAHHLWRVFFLILLVGYTWQWARMRGYAVAVDIHRHQRHRYANQLQVISGWLQLGNSERANQYLWEVGLKSVQQGALGKLPLRWTFTLVRLDALAERYGTMLWYEGIESLEPRYWALCGLNRAVRQTILIADGNPILVVFNRTSFMVRVQGIKRLPTKHIMGVRWVWDEHTLTGSWGRRQETLG